MEDKLIRDQARFENDESLTGLRVGTSVFRSWIFTTEVIVFEGISRWWKLRKKCRDAFTTFWVFHGPTIKRFKYSPINGSRLLWDFDFGFEEPFDPKTGLPTQVRIIVSVRDTSKSPRMWYEYDRVRNKLMYRTRNYGEWIDVPVDT